MFLSKDYVLANELVQNMQINIANISKLAKEFEMMDYYGDIIKMNNCTFLKKTSHRFPKNIKEGLLQYKFTDISNALPCRWVQSEYRMTERELLLSGLLKENIKIAGKSFYVFSDEFVKTTTGKIGYTLDHKETQIANKNGDIEGYIQLSKNKFITWYSINN